MTIDTEKFMHHLESFDLSHAQKVELIHSVAAIMESYVDRAFGLDPVQLSRRSGKQEDSGPPDDPVDSENRPLIERFDRATEGVPDAAE